MAGLVGVDQSLKPQLYQKVFWHVGTPYTLGDVKSLGLKAAV